MKNISIFIVMLMAFAVSQAEATPSRGGYPPYGGYYQQTMPGKLFKQGLDKVIHFLADGGQRDPRQLQQFVEQQIAGYFDFAYMTQWAVGPYFRQMNPGQRAEATQMLRSMFLDAMVRHLAGYQYGRLMYLRPRGNPASGEVQLSVRSFTSQGYPTQLNFRLYRGPQGWKVFDVSVNGQSAVLHYRNVFARRLGF